MSRHLIPIDIPGGWEVVDVIFRGERYKATMRDDGHGMVEAFPLLHIRKTGEAVKPSRRIEIGHCVSKDEAIVPDDRVRFVAADGRTMFEVRPNGDNGIEVRGVDTYRAAGVLYDCSISIEPCGSNSIFVRSLEY